MRNTFLPGLKTNINTLILAGISIAQVAGITIDPEAATKLFSEWWEVIVVANGLLAATGIWFRQLGKR